MVGFQIWCSCDLPFLGTSWEDPGPKTLNTPTACLPTISEGQECHNGFSENYVEFAKRLVTSKGQRPKSMPPIEPLAEQCDTIDSGSMPPGNHILGDAIPQIKSPISPSHPSSPNPNTTQSLGSATRPKTLRTLSQISDISQHSSLVAEPTDKLKNFSEKVNKCAAIVIIVSDNYINSSTSKKQIFYSEGRKQMVIVDAAMTHTSTWYSNLTKRKPTVVSCIYF